MPDMRIEPGGPPRYEGLDLIRARGWTHWHHLFNPRQLLVAGLVNRFSDATAQILALTATCQLEQPFMSVEHWRASEWWECSGHILTIRL